MVEFSCDDVRRGRRRLRELAPWARAEAAKGSSRVTEKSGLAAVVGYHATEAKLDCVMIYPGPAGGWHADVMLKDMPDGAPNTLGSPVEKPFATRAEAEEAAKGILVALFLLMRQRQADPPSRVFLLYQCDCKLSAEAFDLIQGGPMVSKEEASRVLTSIVEYIFPGCKTVIPEDIDRLSQKQRAVLWTAMHLAAQSGVFAYPLREDKPPGSNQER